MGDETDETERSNSRRVTRVRESRGARWRLRKPTDLRAAREKTGHTHRSLAAIAGCAHSMVSHLEAGRTVTVTEALAEDLCAVLGVAVPTLFDRVAP